MSHLRQITLRGLDPRIQREIRELSRRERISMNKAALRLLERGSATALPQPMAPDECIGTSLDHLIGTWTDKESARFLDSIQSCEQIDEELWK